MKNSPKKNTQAFIDSEIKDILIDRQEKDKVDRVFHDHIPFTREQYSRGEELNDQDILINASERRVHFIKEDYETFQVIFHFLNGCSMSGAISVHNELAQKVLPDSASIEEVAFLATTLHEKMGSIFKKIENRLPNETRKREFLLESDVMADVCPKVVENEGCTDHEKHDPLEEEVKRLNSLSYERKSFIPTKALLSELSATGKDGKRRSKKIPDSESCRSFWFALPGEEPRFFLSPAFLVLAKSCWEDIVKPSLQKAKQAPALTLGVNPIIRKAQNKFSSIKPAQNKIEIYHDDALIAETAVISPTLVRNLAKGAKLLGSVQGHKLLRHQVRKGFENWKSGKEDFRSLEYERGFVQIAEELGMKKGKGSHAIKQILEAQAHLYFKVGKTTYGNLIILKQMLNPKTGRDEKVEMILGSELLPYQTFKELDAREKLLVPCVDLPPLVGSTNTHAQQCELQLEMLEHMTENSKDYSEEGGVLIKSDQFLQMAKNTGMTKDTLEKVFDRWTQDGDDGGRFLEQTEKDRFKLGKTYSDADKLLTDQGKLRSRNSERGKKSASKRARKKKG